MSAPEDRPLRLVKPATPAAERPAATPSRSVQRRATTRRLVPRQASDPVALLKRLDKEPVEEPVDQSVEEAASAGSPGKTAPEDAPSKPAAPKAATLRKKRPVKRASAPARSKRSRWRLRRPALPVVLLLLALVAALAATAVFGQRWYAARTLEAAHQQALAAAKQTTVNFVSVSASSVDRDLQRILAGATGDFRDEFQRGQAQVRQAVVENKVSSTGSVLRAALVSGDRRHAVVLVAVDATVKNTKAPEGRPSHYRIQVDVTRDPDSGKWLVAKLQFVG